MKNRVDFKVTGRFALFTDPLTKIGGDKCSYQIPTYEALKGVAKSVYWKPTFVWVVDKVRVMRRIRTQSKSMKPLVFSGGNSLAIYTYLADVEYQVQAHFEWNPFRDDLADDRDTDKHWHVARRMVEKGGRQDIFLGTRECQGYVEPCIFGEGKGDYDGYGNLDYGLMFHGFDYPDEYGPDTDGKFKLQSRFWRPAMIDGAVSFPHPAEFPCPGKSMVRRFVRGMTPKKLSTVGLREEGLLDELV
jgi:CRISPR-associated protein Cas5d